MRANDLAFSCERTCRISDHWMMRGAFVGCNGLLGRPLVRIASSERTQTSILRFVHCASAQARGDQPEESIVISVAPHAYPAPAQARGDQPEESIVISLRCLARQRSSRRRVRRSALQQIDLDGIHASGQAHSIIAHVLTRERTFPPHRTNSPRNPSFHHLFHDDRGAA